MAINDRAAGVGFRPAIIPSRDLDATRLTAWRTLRDAGELVVERVSTELERLCGLPLEWYDVLLHLHTCEESLTQQQIEQRLRLSQSGVSRMVSKMQDARLLRRRPADHDRRNLVVVLTEHGRDVFLRATPEYHAAVQRHFGGWLDDDEVAAITTGLHNVVGATEGEAERSWAAPRLDQLLAFGESVLAVTSDSTLVADAVRTRDALEPLLLLDAARNVTVDGVRTLRELVARMSGLTDSPEEFFRADWDLHRALAGLSHNAVLKAVYLALLEILSSHVDSVIPTGNLESYLYSRLAVHARIVEAVAEGDEEQVAAAAHAHHFTDVRSRLVDPSGGG
jgi:DNA-binding MarR family transcriptional regulator